jgi:hypothetical protein
MKEQLVSSPINGALGAPPASHPGVNAWATEKSYDEIIHGDKIRRLDSLRYARGNVGKIFGGTRI